MQNPCFRNVQCIKDKAPAYLTALGYRLLGYEGSDPNIIFGESVWFQAIRDDSSKLVYTIQLRKQGDGLKWQYERVINEAVTGYVTTS